MLQTLTTRLLALARIPGEYEQVVRASGYCFSCVVVSDYMGFHHLFMLVICFLLLVVVVTLLFCGSLRNAFMYLLFHLVSSGLGRVFVLNQMKFNSKCFLKYFVGLLESTSLWLER